MTSSFDIQYRAGSVINPARLKQYLFIDGNGSIARRSHRSYFLRIPILTPRYIRTDKRGISCWEGEGIVFQDISDRKQAEQILADYNRRLEMEAADGTIELAKIHARLEIEIEERKQAEKIIRPQRDFNLNIIQNSPTFFVAIDSDIKSG